jgi:protein PhnA
MDIEKKLHERSGSACELCNSKQNLQIYKVPPVSTDSDTFILVCQTCFEQINDTKKLDANHWRCLNSSMWSTVPAVQVTAWRLLKSLRNEGWSQDLLDMFFLDDDTLAWAKSAAHESEDVGDEKVIHKDSNGAVLQAGDTVVLKKDLDVKGGGFTAKRGTAVRSISLVEDNAGQIEGRVNGQQIVILTQYVKKLLTSKV